MTFTCDKCKKDFEFDKIKHTHYYDENGYVIGFKHESVLCDVCYAEDD